MNNVVSRWTDKAVNLEAIISTYITKAMRMNGIIMGLQREESIIFLGKPHPFKR